MVKKGNGGGMGEGIDRNYVKKAMDSCSKDLVTAEDIVNDLRSKDAILARLIPQRLLQSVIKILNERNIKRVREEERDDNNGDEEGSATQRKKLRRVDEIDENLQPVEESHLRNRNMERSTASSSSNGEKISPPFDFCNDNLRGNYAKSNRSKNVEVETESSKGRSKSVTMGGSSKLATMEARKEAKSSVSNGYLEADVNENAGPTFKDFGGINKNLYELKLILFQILNPQVLEELGTKPPSGILFHGPPGCGKTRLANAIANEAGLPFYKISATDVVSGVSGASEENIRELFAKAYRTAPSIVFIDEIDAIGSKRENHQKGMENRIVTQLMTCMNGPGPNSNAGYVLVIGSTNRPDALDPALRRSGRFEYEIALSPPDEDARAEILSVIAQKLKLEGPFDMKRIARLTPGFVGADLESVAKLAGRKAFERILQLSPENEDDDSWLRQPWPKEELKKLFITMSDFEEAVNLVQPSLKREGFSTMPDVKWDDDVGGLDHIRSELNSYVIYPIKYPDIYKDLELSVDTGVLLYGPPGCGKTLIAKAAANESGANFIHVKAGELLNKYVGESERAIRTLFQRARTCAPCVIFFDEVDALTTSRGNEGAWVIDGLLKAFLLELDGGEKRKNVYVIGATNMPEVMNPAFLRPGRFGNLLYVPLPNADERASILKTIAKKKPIDPSVDLDSIAKLCEGFSGADLAHLVQKAQILAANDAIRSRELSKNDVTDTNKCTIKLTQFEQALSLISPSVNKQQTEHYEALSKRLQQSVGR